MSQHTADRILAALEAQLATISGVTGVFMQPMHTLNETDLPALIVEEIEDEVISTSGFFPVDEQHDLKFTIFACLMTGSSGFKASVATLHHDVEVALTGTLQARSLGGLLTRGLTRGNATYFVDAESLQKPVGGWRIPFKCTYYLRSDEPGKVEKE